MQVCDVRRGIYSALDFDFENYANSELALVEKHIRKHDLFGGKDSFHNIMMTMDNENFSQFVNDFYFLIEQFNGVLCDSLGAVGRHPKVIEKRVASPARYLVSLNISDELGYYKGSYQDGTFKNSHLALYYDLLTSHNGASKEFAPGRNVKGLIDIIDLEVTTVDAQLYYLLLCEEVAINVSSQLSKRCGENNYSRAHGKYEPSLDSSPADDLHQLDIAALLHAVSTEKQNPAELARVDRIMDSWHAYLLSLAKAPEKEPATA